MHTMSRATRVYSRRFYSSKFTPQDSIERAPTEAAGRSRYERIDWEGMRAAAVRGKIPAPPVLRTEERCRWRLLADIESAAKAGDRNKLVNMNIGAYNSVIRAIKRYRDLCVLALDRRQATNAITM